MSISRLHSIPRFALPYSPFDFAAGLRAMLLGGPDVTAFPLFPGKPKFWTSSGRQALRLLLGALRLRPRSDVALPLFTDPSLIRAVAAAGHRPLFIDVDPRYLTIDPQSLADRRRQFSAVVAVHLFGQLADMPAIMTVAGSAPVIEDGAHAPFSLLDGRMAGTFGVAAFFSFASTKYWPAGGGGLAVVNDASLARTMTSDTRCLLPSSRILETRNILMQAAKAAAFHRRLYGVCARPVRRWTDKWALLEPRLDQNTIQRHWAAVACRQAARLAERVEQQRANSLQLLTRLGPEGDLVFPYERPGARYNYHMFPVLLQDHRERDALRAAMWSAFVDTSMIYSHAIAEARRFGYDGGCPVAESIAERLITLPNYAGLTHHDIDAVADVFRASLDACRRSTPGS
jgi:dTDP-4-amino-4,6-dideoxygalactose transaminase